MSTLHMKLWPADDVLCLFAWIANKMSISPRLKVEQNVRDYGSMLCDNWIVHTYVRFAYFILPY